MFFNYRFSKNELDKLYSSDYNKKRSAYIEGYRNSYDKDRESLESDLI